MEQRLEQQPPSLGELYQLTDREILIHHHTILVNIEALVRAQNGRVKKLEEKSAKLEGALRLIVGLFAIVGTIAGAGSLGINVWKLVQ